MAIETVKIPSALWLDRELSPATKLVWAGMKAEDPAVRNREQMVLDDSRISPTHIAKKYNLARQSVYSSRNSLRSSGWTSPNLAQDGKLVTASCLPLMHVPTWTDIPIDVLMAGPRPALARIMYGDLMLVPGYSNGSGEFKYDLLGHLTGKGRSTLHSTIELLEEQRWVELSRDSRLKPVRFTLKNAEEERRIGEVQSAKERLARAEWVGEALALECLTVVVDRDDFEDDAPLPISNNPYTHYPLRFDRVYLPDVAIEFNGDQHYGTTPLFNDKHAFLKRRTRDYLKLGAAIANDITVITMTSEDLSIATIEELVKPHLPLRDRSRHIPLVRFLEKRTAQYRRKARRLKLASAR